MTASERIIVGMVATALGILTGILGNQLSEDIAYWFTRKGKKPSPKPVRLWTAFFFLALTSVVMGSVATFAPSASAAPAPPTTEPRQVQPVSPTQTSMPVTPTPVAATATSGWSGILEVRRPTLNEIRAEIPVSLWDANKMVPRDQSAPGTDVYSLVLHSNQEYLFPVFWCALGTDTLRQNMDNIETTFSLNSEAIPDKYILEYDYDKSTGWKCTYHAVVLGGWAVNGKYTLESHRRLLTDLSDGQSTYPAGDYILELEITIQP